MHLTYKLTKKSSFIFEYLTDMQKFASVHPVISKIVKTGNNNYLVYETLKLGFIPYSFTYPITIEKKLLDNIVIRAVVMNIIKIRIEFVLKTESDHTLVKEYLKFEAPVLLKFIIRNIFKNQHMLLFENIESAVYHLNTKL